MPRPWKHWDLVWRKADGQAMRVRVHLHPGQPDEMVLCCWYEGDAYQMDTLHPDELTDVEPNPNHASSAPLR